VPILNVQFKAQGQTPTGQTITLPPAAALLGQGPVVPVVLSVAQTIADQLLQQGLPVPAPVSGSALIDTGASSTCIDDATAQTLQLPAIDVVTMTSASHASTQQNIYPVLIEVAGGIRIDVPRAMGANLAPQSLVALIGRDFLQHCTLFYNGPTGHITLSL
jgi:predicted aspartyl protease